MSADIDAALKVAWHEAISASHQSALVSVYVGDEIVEHLRERAVKLDATGAARPLPLLGGFPIVHESGGDPRHISVRTIKNIFIPERTP